MDNMLVKWNTGRIIHDRLEDFPFLKGYSDINKDIYDIYIYLKSYSNSNYNGPAGINYNSDLYNNLIKHLDNMVEFQKLVDSKDPNLDLALEAMCRFDNEHVRSTKAVDYEVLLKLELLSEYCQPIRILFNNLLSLVDSYSMSLELQNEIQEILINKGLDNFEIPNELLINNNQN